MQKSTKFDTVTENMRKFQFLSHGKTIFYIKYDSNEVIVDATIDFDSLFNLRDFDEHE